MALTMAIRRWTSAVKVTHSMMTSGGNSILLLRPVTFRNTHRGQDQGAQQLVGGTEQRPDVGIADLGQQEAEGQSDDGGEVNIAEQLAPALSVLHIIGAEQLLEAHTADTGHGIQAGQGQGGKRTSS